MNKLLLFNPSAGGGQARQRLQNFNLQGFHFMEGPFETHKASIQEYYKLGGRHFVAAGGDGTVYDMLNGLFLLSQEMSFPLSEVSIGAIGLGSSNDSHKKTPGDQGLMKTAIDFNSRQLQDLLIFESAEWANPLVSTLNASIGFTAEANYFFNHPDFLLKFLKKKSTTIAINYAALKTFIKYKPLQIKINNVDISLLNLGLTKSRFFAGDFFYPELGSFDDGQMGVFLIPWQSRFSIPKIMQSLAQGHFRQIQGAKAEKTNQLSLSSSQPFFVEINGEVHSARSLSISVLQKGIGQCQQ